MTLTTDLITRRSVDVLKAGQSPNGSFVASPNFPTYRYAWLRDGAFCARALDAVGEQAASAAFHRFVSDSVEGHRSLIESAITGVLSGQELAAEAFPPARYTLDGDLEETGADEPWPNFQVDGYGMWLWALEQHRGSTALDAGGRRTVDLVARYLETTWPLRCYSCWEELDGGEHAATLGAVVAGLESAARLLEDDRFSEAAARVRSSFLERFVHEGRLSRGPGDRRLDGSMLWLAVPFRVLEPADPLLVATIDAIERDLAGPGGGIYRYVGDTYYGGGQWLLLTSSLAWHHARTGATERAVAAQDWVRASADRNGDLPEQTTAAAQDATMIAPWVERWGPVATPLLWSHAMYLLAEEEIAA